MIGYQDVLQARETIADYIQRTPLVGLRDGIHLKLENKHNPVKAFKIRGALNKIRSLGHVDEVVAAAIGSHGFAVGDICPILGINSVCFMPETAPAEKKSKMEELVDNVIYKGTDFSETESVAMRYADERRVPFIPPYNDGLVIAGQGTVGLEIVEDLEGVSDVYIPVGGGGLLSGVAIAIKEKKPDTRIVMVQPYSMQAMRRALEYGSILPVRQGTSIAEPLCINPNPDTLTFEYVRKYTDDSLSVEEQEIRYAMNHIFEKTNMMVEGAGAIALAAAMHDPQRGSKAVCIVTGGNISDERFFREINKPL